LQDVLDALIILQLTLHICVIMKVMEL